MIEECDARSVKENENVLSEFKWFAMTLNDYYLLTLCCLNSSISASFHAHGVGIWFGCHSLRECVMLICMQSASTNFVCSILTAWKIKMYNKDGIHRAVSPTLCVSYSHTVLSRFIISGVSTVASSSTILTAPPMQCLVGREFKWCIAIWDGGGGGDVVCIPLIWTWGMCRTPAIVPPYVGQWCVETPAGCRGSVQVPIWFWYAFGTGLCTGETRQKWKQWVRYFAFEIRKTSSYRRMRNIFFL